MTKIFAEVSELIVDFQSMCLGPRKPVLQDVLHLLQTKLCLRSDSLP